MIPCMQAKQTPVVAEPNRKPIGYDTRYQRSPIDPCSSPVRPKMNSNSKTSLFVKESFNYSESQKLLRSIDTTTSAVIVTATAESSSAGVVIARGTTDRTIENSGDSDTESCPEDDLPGGIWNKVLSQIRRM
jgi:hypothetical protein